MTIQPGSPRMALWDAINDYCIQHSAINRAVVDRAIAALCEEAAKSAAPADDVARLTKERDDLLRRMDATKDYAKLCNQLRELLGPPFATGPIQVGARVESALNELTTLKAALAPDSTAALRTLLAWLPTLTDNWCTREVQRKAAAILGEPSETYVPKVDGPKRGIDLMRDGEAALQSFREWLHARVLQRKWVVAYEEAMEEIDRRIAATPPSEAQQAVVPDANEVARLKRELARLVDIFERLEGELGVQRDEHSALEGLVDAAKRLKAERDAALARAASELQAVSAKINATHPSWKYVATFVAGRLNAIAVREAMPPIPLDPARVKATVARAKSLADVTVTDVLVHEVEQEERARNEKLRHAIRCMASQHYLDDDWRNAVETCIEELARERLAGGA